MVFQTKYFVGYDYLTQEGYLFLGKWLMVQLWFIQLFYAVFFGILFSWIFYTLTRHKRDTLALLYIAPTWFVFKEVINILTHVGSSTPLTVFFDTVLVAIPISVMAYYFLNRKKR